MSVVGRVIDRIAPPALGTDFRRLFGSTVAANLGDGIALAAGPLLIASQTSSPTLVALGSILQRLPWFLFGFAAGIVADRFDRRSLMIAGDCSRAVVLVLLSLIIVGGGVSIAVVLVAMFLLGSAEAFSDIAADALLPEIVPAEHLGLANARFTFVFQGVNHLAGPPIGAALFAAGMFVPFATQALLLALAVVLVLRMSVAPTPRSETSGSPTADFLDGLRWLWRNSPIRTLTITIFVFNLTWGATNAILVLYVLDRLGLDEGWFGILLAAAAIGGVIGSALYGWFEARFSLGGMMRAGLTVETLSHLGFALTTDRWVAMAIIFAFGLQASVWGTTARSVRQRAVPLDYQGRVGSVYLFSVHTGLVIGGLLGGVIGSAFGIAAVYWYAFVGSALLLVAIWRALPQIAHARPADESVTTGD